MGDNKVNSQLLEQTLKDKLEADYVEVLDTSGGCGQSFNVVVVSKLFDNLPLLKRHRLVNEAAKEEIAQLHAFSQKTFTPAQWEIKKSKST